MRGCVESVVELVGPPAIEKGIEVTYRFEPGVSEMAVGDAGRLRQILLNLLNNAVKFTEHGEVVVTVDAAPASAEGTIAYRIEVRDTGIGIPPDRIDRLFRSFSQADVSTSRRYGGTGLGLAISKRLAELMHGTVSVESTGVPGEGSTFQVRITLGATDLTPTALRRDGSFAGRRALVVDDNATNRALIGELLGAWGIEASQAVDGEAALAAFDADRPDVVVLDMLMPGPDGLEVASRLRERAPDLPLVLASSMARRELEADPRWPGSGIGAFVQKPVKASPLHTAIATVLGVTGDATAENAIPEIDPELGATHPLRILLAEDNVVNQVLALKLLEKLGYRADVAANGVEALEELERRPYDLLLSDIQMPEMDGVELTRRIAERWGPSERPWIVAMTAEAMAGDRERFLAAGMNDYVMKPIRIEELVESIRRAPRRTDGMTSNGPATTVMATPIDEDVLRRLTVSVGNDRAFVAELIGQFATDGPELLRTARTAVAAGDAGEVRRAAHTLKSNAGTFGAAELAAQSRALEEAAKGGELIGAEDRIDGLSRELDRVVGALTAYRDGGGG